MRALELKPTRENLITTLVDNTIKRNEDLKQFILLLNSFDTEMSIALDGDWGSGKTFFVKQAQMILESYNEFCNKEENKDVEIIKKAMKLNDDELELQVPIYYDAWSNDNDNDPILSIVYEIIKKVETNYDFKKEKNWLKIGAQIASFFSGKDIKTLVDLLESEDILAGVKAEKSLYDLVAEFLDSLMIEKGNRLVIFIDELDRCKPSYAVKLLERVKHYFNNDRVTFVFSINSAELQHTVKMYYGQDFDGYRYLDRFFGMRIELPKPDMSSFYSYIDLNDHYWVYDIVCSSVIEYFGFQLREITKFYTTAKAAAYNITHRHNEGFYFDDGRAARFGLMYIVPILIGLKVKSMDDYRGFINGEKAHIFAEIMMYKNKLRLGEDDYLNSDETYASDPQKKTVTIEDKLKEIYSAIFLPNRTSDGFVKIGKYTFSDTQKNELIRISSVLSRHASYDIK